MATFADRLIDGGFVEAGQTRSSALQALFAGYVTNLDRVLVDGVARAVWAGQLAYVEPTQLPSLTPLPDRAWFEFAPEDVTDGQLPIDAFGALLERTDLDGGYQLTATGFVEIGAARMTVGSVEYLLDEAGRCVSVLPHTSNPDNAERLRLLLTPVLVALAAGSTVVLESRQQ